MDLTSLAPDASPEERLSYYRGRGVSHAVLLVPFESLSRIAREAAIKMAAEWGRTLAEIKEARLDIEHAENPRRPLAHLWLLRILGGPTHLVDGLLWADETERWIDDAEANPRLDAFWNGYQEAARTLPPVPPPSRKCRCEACKDRGR
jgi:hypothetical protein